MRSLTGQLIFTYHDHGNSNEHAEWSVTSWYQWKSKRKFYMIIIFQQKGVKNIPRHWKSIQTICNTYDSRYMIKLYKYPHINEASSGKWYSKNCFYRNLCGEWYTSVAFTEFCVENNTQAPFLLSHKSRSVIGTMMLISHGEQYTGNVLIICQELHLSL